MSVLITAAKILDPGSNHHGKSKNVLIEKGKITYIGNDTPKSKTLIHGKGCYLSTGWCDMQANFNDPGFEHKEDLTSGSAAAEAGGYTDVALLPNTLPIIDSKNSVKYVQRNNGRQIVNCHPIAAATVKTQGEEITEMLDLNEAGAIAFSDGNNTLWNTGVMLKSLQYVQKFDGLVIDRPEDKWLSMFGMMNEGVNSALLGLKGVPALAEEVVVARNLELLEYAGGRLHLSNISTEKSVKMIKAAKKAGLNVTADVAAIQLAFDDSTIQEFDANYKVNPPLRTQKDIKALIKGLEDGTIDAIVSAHEPHDEECKKLEFDLADFGVTSLQTVLPTLVQLNTTLSWEDLILKVTSNPRAILKLNQPKIEEGEVANLTLFDTNYVWDFDQSTNQSKSNNSPFYGSQLKGKVKAVFNNGMYSSFE